MVRAGVAPKSARGVSGHQSEAVFDRYNIMDGRDTKSGLAQTQRYRREADNSGEPRQNTDNVSALGSGLSEEISRK